MKTFLLICITCISSLSFMYINKNESINDDVSNEFIDYNEYKNLVNDVEAIRWKRRVSLDQFLKYAKEENTIILDTRSKMAFTKAHIKGAVHLNFSDFTSKKLAEVIPSKDTRILIYCNNNFVNDKSPFVLKSGPLALNIPTFLNLYGYGYENIYELGPSVDIRDGRIEIEGSLDLFEPEVLFKRHHLVSPINNK